MHNALMLVSRVLAGIVAGIAFYFAFFLYEDEEGVWQNRIENLWAAVYDRARVTNSTSVALLNRVSEILRRVFIQLFGKEMLSFQAIAVSTNLSLAGATLTETVFSATRNFYPFDTGVSIPLGLAVTAALILFAALPTLYKTRWSIVASWLSWLTYLFAFRRIIRSELGPIVVGLFYITIPSLLLLSLVCDLAAVIVLRRLFATLTRNISISRMIFMIVLVSVLALAIASSPIIVFVTLRDLVEPYEEVTIARFLLMLNVTTLLSCILPLVMLFVALIHRMLWPTLSRVIYPLPRYKVVTNRKVLIPLGTLAITFAFNLEHVGAKEILKLLS